MSKPRPAQPGPSGTQPILNKSVSTGSAATPNGALSCNGFPAVPDIETLRIEEPSIAPYTLPSEALWFEPGPADIWCKFKNGDKERKIHTNIELEEAEQAGIALMQAEAKRKGDAFYPIISSMASRYLSRARGDVQKALKLMRATQQWRKTYFNNGEEPIACNAHDEQQLWNDLRIGIIYFGGRDYALRPTIVVRANRIPQQWYKDKDVDRLIRMLIFCMEYMIRYMVVPGKVECNNLIVDLKGISTDKVPVSALTDIYKVMSYHYIGRVYTFFIVNLSSTLSFLSGMVTKLLTDRQKQKIRFVNDLTVLRDVFALHQLEEDLGGSRPKIVEGFFPFPLLPGPFTVGVKAAPDFSQVEGAFRCLTKAGARGRVWNPLKSKEENTRLEYSLAAIPIFEQCGKEKLIPPELKAKDQKAKEQKEKEQQEEQERKADEARLAELREAEASNAGVELPAEDQAMAGDSNEHQDSDAPRSKSNPPVGTERSAAYLEEEDGDLTVDSADNDAVMEFNVEGPTPSGEGCFGWPWFSCSGCSQPKHV